MQKVKVKDHLVLKLMEMDGWIITDGSDCSAV